MIMGGRVGGFSLDVLFPMFASQRHIGTCMRRAGLDLAVKLGPGSSVPQEVC